MTSVYLVFNITVGDGAVVEGVYAALEEALERAVTMPSREAAIRVEEWLVGISDPGGRVVHAYEIDGEGRVDPESCESRPGFFMRGEVIVDIGFDWFVDMKSETPIYFCATSAVSPEHAESLARRAREVWIARAADRLDARSEVEAPS